MPTPSGLPKAGEIWRLTKKLPPDWKPVITDVEVFIERKSGEFWALRIRSIETGTVRLWVDISLDWSQGNFKFLNKDRQQYDLVKKIEAGKKNVDPVELGTLGQPKYEPPIQLRDDSGGLRRVEFVKEAFEMAAKDSSIWKISWSEGNHRIRLVRDGAAWRYEPIVLDTGKTPYRVQGGVTEI